MKTRHIKQLFLSCGMAACLGLASCEDFLIREPKDRSDVGTFFTTQNNAIIAVNGIYNGVLETVKGRQYTIDFDCMTDNMYNYTRNQGTQEFAQGTQGASSTYAKNFWQRGYRGISRANTVLANLDKCYETDHPAVDIRERLRAEALFLRAYFYSELTDFFGDVPFYTEPASLTGCKPREKKDVIVKQILTDLENAAKELPVRYEKEDLGRATKGAALALKGKIELYNRMFDEAAETLKQVIDLKDESGTPRYSIYPLYRELFIAAHENNDEIIFDIQYMKDAYNQGLSHQLYTFVYEWNSYCPTVSLAEAYYMKNGLSIDVDPTYDPNNPFVNRDPRLEYTIITPRSDNGRGAQFVPTGGNHTGMKIRKWNDYTESTKNNSEENIILIRYADVLLMRAEALVESGSYDESEVVSLINQIRQRPAVMMPTVEKVEGTNLTSEQLIDIIRHERRVEFAFEGTRISDIRRWRIGPETMVDAWGYKPTSAAKLPPVYEKYIVDRRSFNEKRDYLWPIPQNEINTNPYINAADQNPFY